MMPRPASSSRPCPFPWMENGWQGKPATNKSQGGAFSWNSLPMRSRKPLTLEDMLASTNLRAVSSGSHQKTSSKSQRRRSRDQCSVFMPEHKLPTRIGDGRTKGSCSLPPVAGPGPSPAGLDTGPLPGVLLGAKAQIQIFLSFISPDPAFPGFISPDPHMIFGEISQCRAICCATYPDNDYYHRSNFILYQWALTRSKQ